MCGWVKGNASSIVVSAHPLNPWEDDYFIQVVGVTPIVLGPVLTVQPETQTNFVNESGVVTLAADINQVDLGSHMPPWSKAQSSLCP